MPFQRGRSGNPRGRPSFAAFREAMYADLGAAEMRPSDRALLENAVRMLWKARETKSLDVQARLTNSAARIIERLRKAKPQPKLSTRERIAAALAELERPQP